ncbi:MAG: MATE family efflux transporter [Spirochaetes bacterium]|nr:MATE family efflux transporter [Spirochaetota bacterium]
MDKQKSLYYFENAPIPKAVAHFGVPMMVTMLVSIVYNLVDTAFVGMMKDPAALTATILAMPVFLITNGIGQIFGLGCGSYISRLLGKKDYERIKRVSSFALYGAVVTGTAAIALGFVFLDPIVRILGTSEYTFEPTKQYFSILLGGGLTSILGFSMNMIIRAEGGAKVSMTGNIIGTAANIILDPVFIFTFGMGVRGAAIATVIANAMALSFYIWHIVKKSSFLSLVPADCKVDAEMLTSVFSIGFPSFCMKALYVAGFVVQNNVAAAFGDIYIVAFGLIVKVTALPKQLCQGLCMGVQPLVGYTGAAGAFPRMKETVKKTLLYATLLGFVFAISYCIAGGSLLRLFINNAEIIAIGTPFLRIAVISYLAYGTMYMTTTLFQATGRAVPASAVSLVQETVFIPMMLAGTAVMGADGFAWAIPAGDVTAMLIGLILHKVYRNKLYAGEKAEVAQR